MLDPRVKNKNFNSKSMKHFMKDYSDCLSHTLDKLDSYSLTIAADKIDETSKDGGQIFSIGNGGSAAISNHLCCDWSKGTYQENQFPLTCTSLNSNMALYTAIANDFGLERVFSEQLNYFGCSKDILIAISSSGNSENIIQGAMKAQSKDMFVIGLTGFDGGKLRSLSDISIHVEASNYGVVEDSHQIIMHMLGLYIFSRRREQIMAVVVTGGAGFIGNGVCESLMLDGKEVIAVDDLSLGKIANIQRLLGNPLFFLFLR